MSRGLGVKHNLAAAEDARADDHYQAVHMEKRNRAQKDLVLARGLSNKSRICLLL